MTILRVALDVPLDRLFDYLDNGSGVQVGQRVLVPFGRRQVIGMVVARPAQSDLAADKLKPVVRGFHDEAPLPASSFRLLKFCAEYYHYPLGQALLNALPSRLRTDAPARLPQTSGYRLTAAGCSEAAQAIPARAGAQRRLYQALQGAAMLDAAALSGVCKGWRPVLRRWLEHGWVERHAMDVVPEAGLPAASLAPALNPQQDLVLQSLLAGGEGFHVSLLFGITGSGKTEVYLQWLATVLEAPASQVLVLVPEINLTPQLESRFRARFPHYSMVMLHSQMNESERLHGWMRAQNGSARIVIGTRLAVFTPMPALAAIVVDEEHDASFKQQDGMRYSARDVAIMRAKMAGVPVLLGSATPSLESWFNATAGRYRRLDLTLRANQSASLPAVHCIDTRLQPVQDGLSAPLLAAMRSRLQRGEQSLLFINRRGYAPVLLCSACAWVAPCPRCSSRLVVHLRQHRLRCHHCGHEQRMPSQCPGCGNPDLYPTGHGTQRLEEVLAQQLPEARILRVDRDSMRRRHALKAMSERVHGNAVDILVGTQMLAKGHDFPNLTLVGVVDTDSALYSPDFRAAERLFAQLMQVAGRAGRAGKPGEVLIQTNFPDHPLFHALQRQDFAEFAAGLLEERRVAQFPPYCHEALLRAEATDYTPVQGFLRQAEALAREVPSKVTIYDPVRPRMERLKGMERAQLLVQSGSRKALHDFLRIWIPALRGVAEASRIRWSLDVDPQEY